MTESHIRNVIEAALLAAGKPLQPADLADLFDEGASRPSVTTIQAALAALAEEYSTRGIEIKETATGFRIQVRRELSNEISRLWPERPPKYTRALLETLALIAYKQPITRAEIEAVRGVAVNPNILKSVIERNWVAVVGHRDVPGRPELLGTTREFLDYFGLKRLDELPPLAEIKALGEIKLQFDLPDPGQLPPISDADGVAAGSDAAASGSSAEKADGETAAATDAQTSASSAASGEPGELGAADAVALAAGDEESSTGTASQAADTSSESASQGEDASDEGATRGESSSEGADAVAEASPNDAATADASADDAAAASDDAAAASAGKASGSDTSASDAAAEGAGTNVRGKRGKGRASRDASSESNTASDADTAANAEAVAGDETDEIAGSTESAKKSSSSTGRGPGRKKKRGKASASDSALHEAEEFAASVDADLAAGEDDSSDEDELSAAGPDSSELVAGPRDIDE